MPFDGKSIRFEHWAMVAYIGLAPPRATSAAI